MCLIYNCHNFISVINYNYRFKVIDFFFQAHMTSMPWFWVEQSLGSKLLPPTEWTIKSGVLTLLCLWYISKRKKKSTAKKLLVFEILFLSAKINKPIIYDSGKPYMDKTGIYLLIFFLRFTGICLIWNLCAKL